MKILMKLGLVGLLLAGVGQAAGGSGAGRNLEWAAVTLDKIEKDLTAVGYDAKDPNSAALVTALAGAHTKLTGLKQGLTVTNGDSKAERTVADFAKNLAVVAQLSLDRMNDLADKRANLHKLMEGHPGLAKTDFAKKFDETLLALSGSLVRQSAEQLAERPLPANEFEGVWNLQAVRFDQLIDEGWDEGAYLEHKEEMLGKIRESGKNLTLTALETAREKVRAVRHAQQEIALDKQNHANQVAQQNVVMQSLDEKAGQLNEAADKAREAYDQVQDKLQQAIDADQ